MTVISHPKSILSDSTVSSSSEEYSPFAPVSLGDPEILNNTFFLEMTVNSSQQCILPCFTVPSNLGEFLHKSKSHNRILRTFYNNDLVPSTVNDPGSDESHETFSHESQISQADSIPSVQEVLNIAIRAHSSDLQACSIAPIGNNGRTDVRSPSSSEHSRPSSSKHCTDNVKPSSHMPFHYENIACNKFIGIWIHLQWSNNF